MLNHARTRFLLLLTVLAMIAAACGGGGDGETTSSGDGGDAGDAGQTEEAAAEGEPLRVVVSEKYGLPMVGADAGVQLGIFEEMGLNVEVVESQDAVPSLASGDIDVGISSPNRFIGGIEEGLEATIVGPTVDEWAQFIIVRDDHPAQTLEELDGGKIGISSFGSAGHYASEKVAELQEWGEGDYEIVTLGDLDAIQAALRNGTIDAFMWSAGPAFSLEAEGEARILGSVADVIGPNPIDVITVRNEVLEQRPDDVRAFCEGFYQAQEQFKNDQALAEDIYINEWDFDPEVTPAILEAGLPILSTSDELSDEMLANMAEATRFTIDGSEVTAEEVAEMYTPCSEV